MTHETTNSRKVVIAKAVSPSRPAASKSAGIHKRFGHVNVCKTEFKTDRYGMKVAFETINRVMKRAVK